MEIYYKMEPGEDKLPLEPLYIPNCGQRCPLNKIFEMYQDILPTEDFDTECRLQSTFTSPKFEQLAIQNTLQKTATKNTAGSATGE